MGSISDYTENEVIDHIFGGGAYSPVATVYIGLSTADPLDTGVGLAEPSGFNYGRKSVPFNAASSRKVENSNIITFPTANGSWGTITHWGIFDGSAAGNMLAHGSLATAKQVVSGNTPTVAAQEVDIEFNSGEISTYCAEKILNFVFRNVAFTVPPIYCALATADLTDATTGSTITEVSGNGYTRKRHIPWVVASGGATSNNGDLTFPIPSGSWGLITAAALADGSTGGNILFYENTITEQTPQSGDTVKFPSGDFDVSLT